MTNPEHLLLRTILWATAGAACAVPILVLPQPGDPLLTVLVHLSLMALFGIALAFHLAPLVEAAWFDGIPMGSSGRTALTWGIAIAQITAAAGFVAIPTSAAFRYDPSLQFLIVIVTMWLVATSAATVLGGRGAFGGSPAFWIALVVATAGVLGVWRYFDAVGFTSTGGWLVDGEQVMRLVVPIDLLQMVAAVTVFSFGVRRRSA